MNRQASAVPLEGQKPHVAITADTTCLPAAAVLGLGAVAAASPIQGSDMADSRAAAGAAAEEAAPALPRKDAVLVLGGTGKLGRRVVEQVSFLSCWSLERLF